MDDKPKSAVDILSNARAVDYFRESPEGALAGQRPLSAETDPEADYSSRAVMKFAKEAPERFLELVGYLPHAIQDMFFQYYLLGRTQTQIGTLLGLTQTKVWPALRLGTNALCAIIASGGQPDPDAPGTFGDAYREMLAFQTKPKTREPLEIVSPETLGEFEIRVDDATLELQFAPCTTNGAVSRDSSC